MALIADNPQDRAEQLLAVTERLTALISEDTSRLKRRDAPLDGPDGEEKNRLVNAYRLELTRIRQEPGMIREASKATHERLRAATIALQEALAAHELELGALKFVTEGLVQAMAEETNRQRGGARSYGSTGDIENAGGPSPALIDRTA